MFSYLAVGLFTFLLSGFVAVFIFAFRYSKRCDGERFALLREQPEQRTTNESSKSVTSKWLIPTKIDLAEANRKIENILGGRSCAAKVVLRSLSDPKLEDGLSVLVIDEAHKRKPTPFPKQNIDNRVLTDMLQKYVPNVVQYEDEFLDFVRIRCNKGLNTKDKWTARGVWELNAVFGLKEKLLGLWLVWFCFGGLLQRHFPEIFRRLNFHNLDKGSVNVDRLVGKSCDGALQIYLDGKFAGASVMIKVLSEYNIKKGTVAAGTRHASACAAAAWLMNNQVAGIVLVRSEGGSVTLLVVEDKGIAAYSVEAACQATNKDA